MNANVGTVERALRAIAGVALMITGWLGLTGIMGILAVVVGIVLFVTALISYCPIHAMLGTNTCEAPDSRGH